jgi:hypothetical protein
MADEICADWPAKFRPDQVETDLKWNRESDVIKYKRKKVRMLSQI